MHHRALMCGLWGGKGWWRHMWQREGEGQYRQVTLSCDP